MSRTENVRGARLCFHVGYHKTASTWMQLYAFDLHRNITLLNAPASEFDRFWYHGFVEAGDYTYDRQSVFSGLQRAIGKPEAGRVYVLSEENISGHTYSGWNAARNAERLRDLVSGCRIFLVIRNQAAYIGSAYVNYVNQGGALGFRQWLNDHDIPVRTILDKLKYHHAIEHYRRLFGDANVLVLPYEMMKRDRGIAMMNRFFAFVGVQQLPDSAFEPIIGRAPNVGLSPLGYPTAASVEWRAWWHYKNQSRAVKVLDMILLGRRRLRQSKAEHRMLEEVAEHFRDSNRRTADLIGIDLGQYGYPM